MVDFIEAYAPSLVKALPATLVIWILAVAVGAAVGLLLALIRVYAATPLAKASAVYVDVVRGTPMLVQMFILYFGLPEIGIVFSPFVAATLAIGLNSAAYQAEYFRAGFLAIPSNQVAAARALGMKKWCYVRHVSIPQAMRIALPAWSNEFVVELQYSSLAFTIGVTELTGAAQKICSTTYRCVDAYLLAGAFYLVLTGVVVTAFSAISKRFAITPAQ
ncbi:amino acid ABC transporter permease [Rhizobium sp. NXC24]|uniref:amino acid ABC transporter permease n=1 Tax=Rhizobium sp. NXC24 TaxID=2048897 RepID=UPI000CDF4B75|nr:amino acid ABC transporter permease [Rhizobium sp. NXC24]AVA24229.1 amino acid ABC transporter permease protein [Rhizobium sp. NXC24]